MGLSRKPSPAPVNPQQPPKARDDVYRSAVVDEEYNSQLGLLNYAAGFSVECDYYEQVLGEADEQSEFQLNRDIAEQQLRLIRHFPVKLQSSLVVSYDSSHNRFTSEGTIVMPAVSKPYIGNILLLTGLDHRTAVYSISRITPKNISLAPAYECEIAFQRILDDAQLEQLRAKTVEETLYDQDQLKHGKNPVMATSKYNRKYDYLRRCVGICHAYYHEFYSRELNTLLVPDQPVATYDPWCTNAFTRLWQTVEEKPAWNFGRLNVDDNQEAQAISVFDWVMNGRVEEEHRMTVVFKLMSVQQFFPYPAMGGIRFSGARYCVWPASAAHAKLDLDDTGETTIPNPLVPNRPPLEYDGVPLFPSVLADPYYVFSEAFYRNEPPMSVIESMVREMVLQKPVSHPALLACADALPFLRPIDRYYLTPFVIMLLRAGAIEP